MGGVTRQDDALVLLRRTPLFAGLGPADLQPLLPELRWRHFARESYIFREGDPGDHGGIAEPRDAPRQDQRDAGTLPVTVV